MSNPLYVSMLEDRVQQLSAQPLTQELLNSIMRSPGEAPRASASVLPACPQCGERYCGDGVQLCTECAAPVWGIQQYDDGKERQNGNT